MRGVRIPPRQDELSAVKPCAQTVLDNCRHGSLPKTELIFPLESLPIGPEPRRVWNSRGCRTDRLLQNLYIGAIPLTFRTVPWEGRSLNGTLFRGSG